MRPRKLLALAALVLALCAAGPAQAQTTLRYKFKEGEKLPYALTSDVVMTINLGGMDLEMKMKQTTEVHFEIQKVDAQGHARVRATLGRVKLALDSPTGNAEYDSTAKEEDPEGLMGKILAKMGKGFAGFDMTFTLTPEGQMKNVKLAKGAMKGMKGLPGFDQFGSMMGPEGLKALVALPALPGDAVTKGKKWSEKATQDLPIGKVTGEENFTYEGQVEKGGKKLEKIVSASQFKGEADPKVKSPIKIKAYKAKGQVYLDNQTGRLLEFTNEGTFEGELELMGNSLPVSGTQNTSLKLQSRPKGGAKK